MMLKHDDYGIALYYCYIPIQDDDKIQSVINFHNQFIINNDDDDDNDNDNINNKKIGGRIRIASEGLNGVLSGLNEELHLYENKLRNFLLNEIKISSSNNNNNTTKVEWELDVKYCKLRLDLDVSVQLFTELLIQKTNSVVGLVDMNGYYHYHHDDNNNKQKKSYSAIRRDKRNKKKQQQQQQQQLDNDLLNQQQQQQHKKIQEIYYKSLLLQQQHQQLDSDNNNTTTAAASNASKTMKLPSHLSPQEWNEKLDNLSKNDNNVILLDCRNVYESNIGYFKGPKNTKTILTNTRKYSELPNVLISNQNKLHNASHIFMYCTGGVRCERASTFVQQLLLENSNNNNIPEIYQLHGGIQKYLEYEKNNNNNNNNNEKSYYYGKNFVFDPRRTDPTIITHDNNNNNNNIVGHCLVCNKLHDDYDNGNAPAYNKETRCYKCRILILVCNDCRNNVICWGDDDTDTNKPKLYCGGLATTTIIKTVTSDDNDNSINDESSYCLHMPPVREIIS